jgi:acetylornithine deacetylase/succinyl-diaminopimelate desuccinylase-like protein
MEQGRNSSINKDELIKFIEKEFSDNMLPNLKEFVKIPNGSPHYDKDWKTNGYLLKAANHIKNFAENCGIKGLKCFLKHEEDRTPFLIIKVDSTSPQEKKSIMLYGHFDKQPPFIGWDKDKGPYTPVIQDDYLYGRGASDDGYAIFGALTCIKALQNFKVSHPKFIILGDGCEESGSIDLPIYIEENRELIGAPDMVITLDSGAGDYDRLWITNALRGVVAVDLKVKCLNKSICSKYAGIPPDCFMIIRKLISRLEKYDISTNQIRLKDFEVNISDEVRKVAKNTIDILGDKMLKAMPLYENTRLITNDPYESYLNNIWRPSLTIVGASGIPRMIEKSDLITQSVSLRMSIRTPPTFDSSKGKEILESILLQDPPFNCSIQISESEIVQGTEVKSTNEKFKQVLSQTSELIFNKEYAEWGIGGSIPFVKILINMFSQSLFLVTGAGGLDDHIHGPNERLNLTYCKNLMCCLTHLISKYADYL